MANEKDRIDPSTSFLDEESLVLARLLKRNYRTTSIYLLVLAVILFLVLFVVGAVFDFAEKYFRIFRIFPMTLLMMGIVFFAGSCLKPTYLLRMQRWVAGSIGVRASKMAGEAHGGE